MSRLVAIVCSDLHLSLRVPACRAETASEWLGVQRHYLDQIKDLAKTDIPVLCAGDIFDHWNAPPELIHFALKHLPDGMICVPGQHDLPNHAQSLMHRSGYGVLVQAGKIEHLSGGTTTIPKIGSCEIEVTGFGWGDDICPTKEESDLLKVAIIHRYIWTKDYRYPDAPMDANIAEFKKNLSGYSVAAFGDNHKGFIASVRNCNVINCGGFIRRKSDEIDYQPGIGLVYSDGTIKRYLLDTAKDRFVSNAQTQPETAVDMKAFIDQLESLGDHGLDFRTAVETHLRDADLSAATKEIILTALDQNERP